MSAIFNFIQQFFAVPFGFILSLFYNLTHNYIVAIILLTILVKLCFLPDAINQQKNALKQKKINLKILKLRELYPNDQEKLAKETQKLRKSENQKKGGLGCLSFVVQLIVLIGLFNVIYTPLTNILRIEDTTIQEIAVVMSENKTNSQESASANEITILKEIDNYKNELINKNILSEQTVNEIITFRDEYNFLGINLSHSPELKELNVLWLFPVLVLTVGVASSLYSLLFRKKYNPGKGKFTALDALPFISPMILFVFAFMTPAGVAFYWAISNLLSFIQTMILNTIFNPYKVTLSEEEKTQLINGAYNEEASSVATDEEPKEKDDTETDTTEQKE